MRFHRRRGKFLGCLVAVASLSGVSADRLEGPALLDRVQQWLDGTRDLQGRFEQELLSGAMGTGVGETGEVFIQRPGRMRWDYRQPERKIALLDGEKTLLYLAEDAELIRGRLDEETDLLPKLLAGTAPLAELFRASSERGRDGNAYRLVLVPRGEERSFERVTLTVRPPRFAIEAAEVLDAAGNRVRYAFFDLRRNEGLPPGLFHFEPPPGTVVSGEP